MIKYCRSTLLSASAGAVFLVAGCAPSVTPEQLSEVQQIAEEAMRTANTADYQASQAKSMADEALTATRHMKMKMMKKRGMKSMMK